jgi:hypothetical protein
MHSESRGIAIPILIVFGRMVNSNTQADPASRRRERSLFRSKLPDASGSWRGADREQHPVPST